MLVITKINALNNYSGATKVQWEVADTSESTSDYMFNVYSSASPDSGFVKLNDDLLDVMEYTYVHPYQTDSSVRIYFKVESLHVSTGTSSISNMSASTYLTPRDPVADTIMYQHDILLEHVLGRPVVKLLVKRRSGTRCPVCWDDELMEVRKSNCTSCYSVGYEGGYLPPKDIYISFAEPGFMTKFDITDVKDVQQGITQAWSRGDPLILPGDVIVDKLDRRFIVIQVQPTTRSGVIYLRQLLQLQLIPPTNVIYKLDV